MTWSFQAAGHTPTPDGEETDPQPWKAAEERLLSALAFVLDDPAHGTSSWQFAGNFVADQYPRPEPAPPVERTVEEQLADAQLRIAELEAAAAAGGVTP